MNLGFTGTANRGMALSRRDVVLLNSDTIVTPGWLEALLRCAASDAGIGTITPWSNNAEILSYPRFCENNRWRPATTPRRSRPPSRARRCRATRSCRPASASASTCGAR